MTHWLKSLHRRLMPNPKPTPTAKPLEPSFVCGTILIDWSKVPEPREEELLKFEVDPPLGEPVYLKPPKWALDPPKKKARWVQYRNK